jgi:hypothetical protein
MFHCGRDNNMENIPLKLITDARHFFSTSEKVAWNKSITDLALYGSQMKWSYIFSRIFRHCHHLRPPKATWSFTRFTWNTQLWIRLVNKHARNKASAGERHANLSFVLWRKVEDLPLGIRHDWILQIWPLSGLPWDGSFRNQLHFPLTSSDISFTDLSSHFTTFPPSLPPFLLLRLGLYVECP